MGFCKSFSEISKQLVFSLTSKIAALQDNIKTTAAIDIISTIDKLNLYVPNFFPHAGKQTRLNSSTEKTFNSSIDSWFTDKKVIDTELEYGVDMGYSHKINSSKLLIVTHLSFARRGVPNKADNSAVFDKLSVRKHFVETVGSRYPKSSVFPPYSANKYLDQ